MMNPHISLLTTIIAIIALLAVFKVTVPKVSFAGINVMFSEGQAPIETATGQPSQADQEEPENEEGVEQAENADTDIQDLAAKNAEEQQRLHDEGKSAPPLPATPGNVAAYQNRGNLSEEARKPLEPVQTHKPKEDTVTN